MSLSWLVALLACTPAAQPVELGEEAAEDTAAMVFDAEPPEPLWTADELGVALTRIMAIGAPNPIDIAQAFLDLMSRGDLICPGDDEYMLVPPEGCETAIGYRFTGVGWYESGQTYELEDGSRVDADFGHNGDYEITRPDGSRLTGGGGLAYTTEYAGGASVTSTFDLHGSFKDEGREDWLAVGFSGVFEAVVYTSQDGGWAYGATGGIGLGDGDDLFLDGARWASDDACAGRLSGSIHLRDARGFWTEWALGDDCDDCGEVIFHESQSLGELCLETTAWGRELHRQSALR